MHLFWIITLQVVFANWVQCVLVKESDTSCADSSLHVSIAGSVRLCPSLVNATSMTLSHANTPWIRKSQRNFKGCLVLQVMLILLSRSGDIESNPGPATDLCKIPDKQFACILCDDKVSWQRVAICCDTCDKWAHRDCAGINSLPLRKMRYT